MTVYQDTPRLRNKKVRLVELRNSRQILTFVELFRTLILIKTVM